MPEVMKTVGRYEMLRELGRGGMAKVYLARQTDLDRFVALKELGAFHQDDESFAQRFLRESRVAGSLSHPNIVTVHDYFQHEGTPYIAMEFVERGSLRPWVGKMTLAQIGGVLEGLLAGLSHAEEQGIVHRDLKPENLMVTSDGRVKIADFGIAKARNKMQTGAFLTATGTTVGTPTYMAPEQAMAQEVGPWTDLYSVGVMAFEMFVGRVPFHDSDAPMAILLRHVNEEIPPANSINPAIHPAISEWIQKLLIKDVNKRTRSCQVAWDEFESILIELLGPRWRREARLTGDPGDAPVSPAVTTDAPVGGTPLTPAPFQAGQAPDSAAWGPSPTTPPPGAVPATGEVSIAGGPVAPPPYATPPTPTPVPGPDTPPPGPGVTPGPDTLDAMVNPPAQEVDPSEYAVEPTGMLTFGAPGVDTPAGQQPPPVAQPPGPQTPPPMPRAQTPPPMARAQTPPPMPQADGAAGADLAATRMPQRVTDGGGAAVITERKPKREREAGARNLVPYIVGGALLAAAVGFGGAKAVGGGSKDEAPVTTAPTKPITGELASFRVSSKATQLPAPQIPGLQLAGASVGTTSPTGNSGIVEGKAQDPDPATLLPKQFVEALGAKELAKQPVELSAGMRAYKYTGLTVQSVSSQIAVYAIPTDKGVEAFVCYAPSINAFGPECEASAVTLKLSGEKPVTLGPNPDNAAKYTEIFDGLNGKVAAGLKAMGSAKTPKAQGKAANDIAAAYSAASKAMTAIAPAEFVDQQLTSDMSKQLAKAGKAYTSLSKAATKHNKKGYAKARTAVANAQKDIQGSLGKFAAAGYPVKS